MGGGTVVRLFQEILLGIFLVSTPTLCCKSLVPKATRQCSFPFKYDGVTYSSCTAAGNDDGRLWCGYDVEESEDVKNTGKWVWCDSEGSTSGQRTCQIPFRDEVGQQWWHCKRVSFSNSSTWCYFTHFGVGRPWGICPYEDASLTTYAIVGAVCFVLLALGGGLLFWCKTRKKTNRVT